MSPRYDLVVMGTSTGGLHALTRLLSALPASFPLPIAIVQHRSRDSDERLAMLLSGASLIPVVEAEDKEPLRGPGVYLSPPDYHLLVETDWVALSTEEPVAYSRPSIDVLFESAAYSHGSGVIGVLLTGANQDGTRGLKRIKEHGGYVIIQNPDSAESAFMPKHAVKNLLPDRVLNLEQIAGELITRAGDARSA
ncbi:MAG TPA: chemotaxis protein CheB [Polyangiaceae bacterium]|nr:chemotaxis protein CheB [Polyangiaceae bacterium]